jgi:hypothetical protein
MSSFQSVLIWMHRSQHISSKDKNFDESYKALPQNRYQYSTSHGANMPTHVLDQVGFDETVRARRRQKRRNRIRKAGRNRTTSNSDNGAGLSQRSTDGETDGLAGPTRKNK